MKADVAVVVIETDAGVSGIGEACAYGNPLQISDWVQWFAPSLIDAEIDDFSVVPRPTGTALQHATGSAHDFAVAGIDSALWDLRAKQARLPLSRLLSPSADPSVEVYASTGVNYDWRNGPESLIATVAAHAERGYSTAKIRLGTHWAWDGVTTDDFLRLYDLVQAEVGGTMKIAVDGNSRLNRAQAMHMGRGLQDRGAPWFEEPLPKSDLEGFTWLADALELKISGGESFTTSEQFRPWIEAGAFDIVQPDAGVCGISEVMRIGALAADAGLELIPHSWHNGLMVMANAHSVAALPNAPMVEENLAQGPLRWGIVDGGTRVRDGRLDLEAGVGLGVELIPRIEELYPYVEGHYSIEVYRR